MFADGYISGLGIRITFSSSACSDIVHRSYHSHVSHSAGWAQLRVSPRGPGYLMSEKRILYMKEDFAPSYPLSQPPPSQVGSLCCSFILIHQNVWNRNSCWTISRI